MEVIDFRTKEQKKADFKRAVSEKWNAFAGWIRDNKDVLILCTPVVITVVGGGTRVLSKAIANHTVNKEIRFKERTIYDHSLGRYIELKKPLTSAQSLEIERRRYNGEKLYSILESMKLLKK